MLKISQIEPLGISQELQNYYKELITKNHLELHVWDSRPANKNEIIERCENADIIVLSNISIDKEILNNLPKLKMISVAFTGIDHIDMEECCKRGIIVKNAAGYSTTSVAELTLGLAISMLRNIVINDKRTKTGKGRDGYVGTELRGKTIGIIGMGRIGQEVAAIFHALGCNIMAWSRNIKKIPNVRFVSLDKLLSDSDIITLHIPLTNETKGMIDTHKLSLLKPSSFIINTSRGQIINSEALLDALNNERIAGVALDVYDYEPPLLPDYPLLNAKNTIMLPHIAYATNEAFELRAKIVFNNILEWKTTIFESNL